MTTEEKALALVNEVVVEGGGSPVDIFALQDDVVSIALYRAIEQHEAAEQELQDFKQEVSDELREYFSSAAFFPDCFRRFIIPAPKPVPLEEILEQSVYGRSDQMADRVRAALDALGFEIREKSDD